VEGIRWFFTWLGLGMAVVVWVQCIFLAQKIGLSKGREDGWKWGLFFGPLGVLLLYFLSGRE